METYVSRNGKVTGPFTDSQLREMVEAKILTGDDNACRKGDAQWTHVRDILGLLPPLPPSEPPILPIPAPVTKLQGVGGWLLFFCIILTIINPIRAILGLGIIYATIERIGQEPYATYNNDLVSLMKWQGFWSAIVIIYGFSTGLSIWRGAKNGRALAMQFLKFQIYCYIFTDAVSFVLVSSAYYPQLMAENLKWSILLGVIMQSVFVVIWWQYFMKSLRVKNTYNPESLNKHG